VSANPSSESAAFAARSLVRPRQLLVSASAWGGLLTGATAIWVATELGLANVGWLPWLAWLARALPPAIAGAVCLARRRASSMAPGAVFASCAAACAYAVGIPAGRSGLVLAASVLLVVCAGATVLVSALVTGVLINVSRSTSDRRAAIWLAAGLVFAGLSIPSPYRVAGVPIQTIFAGNTGGENVAAIFYLVLLALPLIAAGLSSARLATVIAVAWLPGAIAQPLSWDAFRSSLFPLDGWYYGICLACIAVAVLALAEARRWRSGPGHPHASPPGS
jgi:hypothetical protein